MIRMPPTTSPSPPGTVCSRSRSAKAIAPTSTSTSSCSAPPAQRTSSFPADSVPRRLEPRYRRENETKRSGTTTTLLERIDGAVVEDKERGLYRCRDGEMYELEMQHIFEGNWVFLAHE